MGIFVLVTSSLNNNDNILRHYLHNAVLHMSFSSGITVAEGLYVQCTANDGSCLWVLVHS